MTGAKNVNLLRGELKKVGMKKAVAVGFIAGKEILTGSKRGCQPFFARHVEAPGELCLCSAISASQLEGRLDVPFQTKKVFGVHLIVDRLTLTVTRLDVKAKKWMHVKRTSSFFVVDTTPNNASVGHIKSLLPGAGKTKRDAVGSG